MGPESSQGAMPKWQQALLARHQLAPDYLPDALKWFAPLAQALAVHQIDAGRPVLVGLNGCQGSGKTTLSDLLANLLRQEHGRSAVALSIDDFYLTAAQRQALAQSVHPLLRTRGVPGTHDMPLLQATLTALLDVNRTTPVAIPRFDKAKDDRHPLADSIGADTPVDVVILEGWCLGAAPQTPAALQPAINSLERQFDPHGLWRNYCNGVLERQFPPLYALVDQWIMLAAPSFDCVFRWRREQERKLASSVTASGPNSIMDDAALRRFIQHYERITRDCLQRLPGVVDHLFKLDQERHIVQYLQPCSGVQA